MVGLAKDQDKKVRVAHLCFKKNEQKGQFIMSRDLWLSYERNIKFFPSYAFSYEIEKEGKTRDHLQAKLALELKVLVNAFAKIATITFVLFTLLYLNIVATYR